MSENRRKNESMTFTDCTCPNCGEHHAIELHIAMQPSIDVMTSKGNRKVNVFPYICASCGTVFIKQNQLDDIKELLND